MQSPSAGRHDIADDGRCLEHCDLSLTAAEQNQGIVLAYEALIEEDISSGRLVKLFDTKTLPKIIYSVTCPECWLERPRIAAFRRWLFDAAGRPKCARKQKVERTDQEGYVPALPYAV